MTAFNPAATHRYAELLDSWHIALMRLRDQRTLSAAVAESTAHDELIDYVEAHGLAGGVHDPRSVDFPRYRGGAAA